MPCGLMIGGPLTPAIKYTLVGQSLHVRLVVHRIMSVMVIVTQHVTSLIATTTSEIVLTGAGRVDGGRGEGDGI